MADNPEFVSSERTAETPALPVSPDLAMWLRKRDFSGTGEGAVEHIEHLPEITDPEAFDKVDDSIFNDQNDSGNERAEQND